MKVIISLLLSLFIADVAHARAGAGAGLSTSGLKDGTSLTGLCSQDPQNLSGRWAPWCKDIDSELEGPAPSCHVGGKTKNSLGTASKGGNPSFSDELRLQILADNNKDKDNYEGFGEACPPDKLKEILNDSTKFELFLKQVLAVLTIQESEWSPRSTSYMGAKGLMQLDRASVAGYKSCSPSCAALAKSGNVSSDNDNNMKCGTTIAMYWMVADGTMGTGSGNKGSRGIARYFQPFRNIDRANRRWMMAKTKNYCENRIDQEAGGTATTPGADGAPGTSHTGN